MKLDMVWERKIGNGVIDCAIDEIGETIVAGDVNGKVVKMNYNGELIFEYQANMPVWAVDTASAINVIAIGTANKEPFKGELIIIVDEILFDKVCFDCPVWDVKIIEHKDIVLVTTWGEGFIVYNFRSKDWVRISIPGNLFGISIMNNSAFVASSGYGIYSVSIEGTYECQQITGIEDVCYNLCQNGAIVFSGSTANELFLIDKERQYQLKSFSTLLEQPCGIAISDNELIVGDLLGNLYISNISLPNVPIYFKDFGNAIWNIDYSKSHNIMFIACGNGYLYKLTLDRAMVDVWDTDTMPFDTRILKGAKVFISYAKEDAKSAVSLYEAFKTIGCKPWLDEINLLPGQQWQTETENAISDSDFMIICLSKIAVQKRGYIQKEIRQAIEIIEYLPTNKIFIIPIRLDDCIVPDHLKKWQWVDLHSEHGFHKLLYSIYVDRVKNQPY